MSDFRFPQHACKLIFLLSAGSYHSLLLFLCIATIPQLLVIITDVNATSLCLSAPAFDFDYLAAFFVKLLPFRVFSSCDERDHLLIFPTTIQRTIVFSCLPGCLSSDWPVTAFSSVQYPFAACLLSSFPVLLSAFTEVFASGFVLPKKDTRVSVYINTSFLLLLSVEFRFKHLLISNFRRSFCFLSVCIDLINFRRTHLSSEELSVVFSHSASTLLSFFPPVCLIPSFHFHVLLLFRGFHCLGQLEVTIAGLNGPYLCLNSPNLTFHHLAALSC